MIKNVLIIALGTMGTANAETHWTGLYSGMDAGVAANHVQLNSHQLGFTSPSEECNGNSYFSTFIPGIQLGYLYQFQNHLVTGVEANVTVNANQTNKFSCHSDFNSDVYDQLTFKNYMQTSIKGRFGWDLNWNNQIFLPYLTAGASFANVGLAYENEADDHYSQTSTTAGWLVGAGIEWAFMSHWSLRAEYTYIDYGKAITLQIPVVYDLIDSNGHGNVDLNSHNLLFSINYWV